MGLGELISGSVSYTHLGLLQVYLYIAQNCIMAIPAFIGEKGLSNLIYGIIMIVV